MRLLAVPGAGAAAGVTFGFVAGAGPRDVSVAVAGRLPPGLAGACGLAGDWVVGRRLCIAIF